jgi:polysaccharide pyruvyl transferase WcaK-like protein
MNRRRRDEAVLLRTGLITCDAVAVSVGPFRNADDERHIREFLKRFRSISVRDRGSFERTVSMDLDTPIRQSFDLAVLLREQRLETPRRRSIPRFGVALRYFESQEGGDLAAESTRLRSVVEVLNALSKTQPIEVVLLAFNSHPQRGDVSLAHTLADEIKPFADCEVVAYDGDVGAFYSAVAGCDAVLAMRLHAAIFAYTAGVPFGLINYHPKCAEFAHQVQLPSAVLFESDASDLRDRADLMSDLINGMLRPGLSVDVACTLARGAFDLLEHVTKK